MTKKKLLNEIVKRILHSEMVHMFLENHFEGDQSLQVILDTKFKFRAVIDNDSNSPPETPLIMPQVASE